MTTRNRFSSVAPDAVTASGVSFVRSIPIVDSDLLLSDGLALAEGASEVSGGGEGALAAGSFGARSGESVKRSDVANRTMRALSFNGKGTRTPLITKPTEKKRLI